MAETLEKFLERVKVPKGVLFTHTSLKGGSYYIGPDDFEKFMNLYIEAAEAKKPLHLTEKHREICPIIIDFDFRQSKEEHLYTKETIGNIIIELLTPINEYLDTKDKYEIIVLTKKGRLHDKDKQIYKDGLHIIIPHVVTQPDFQFFLRQQSLSELSNIFSSIGVINNIEEVYDKCVIKSNNWLMYGSNKPDEKDTWKIKYNFIFNKADYSLNEQDDTKYTFRELVYLLSIVNKYDETPYKEGKSLMKRKSPQSENNTIEISTCIHTSSTLQTKTNIDHEYIKSLLDTLNPIRAENYESWIRVGWCLFNIEPSECLLEYWRDFSKLSDKFKKGECEKLWQSFWQNRANVQERVSMGSLCQWAKEDNFDQYKEITDQSIRSLIQKSRKGDHTDIARVIHRCYKDMFRCTSIKKGVWYEFVSPCWEPKEHAYSLRQYISNHIVKLYIEQSTYYYQKSLLEEDNNIKQHFTDKAKQLAGITSKLKLSHFKDAVIKEASEFFMDEKFMNYLDENPKLLGFNNGIYDLRTHQFQDGYPDDYVTMTTKYDYTGTNDDDIQNDIFKFIKSIMKNEEMKEYLLKIMAYMLDGEKYLEQLWFFTGNGRNGKGSLCSLLQKTFGDYYYEPDISFVTSSNKSSSAANPELAKAKGKRLIISSEPEDEEKDSKFRVSRLKKYRGNDLIQARGLYQAPIEFKPQFGMIFQMNDKPELSKVDDAIAKSLKIIEFPYQFVHEPKLPHQRPIDTSLKMKFEQDIRYKQQFMLILLDYHKRFIQNHQNITDPQEVVEASAEYIEDNNPLVAWLDMYMDVTNNPEDRITPTQLRQFYESDTKDKISKEKFKKLLNMLGHVCKRSKSQRYYSGLKRKQMVMDDFE